MTVGNPHEFSGLSDIATNDGEMSVLLLFLTILVNLFHGALVKRVASYGINRVGRVDDDTAIANHLCNVLDDAGIGIVDV